MLQRLFSVFLLLVVLFSCAGAGFASLLQLREHRAEMARTTGMRPAITLRLASAEGLRRGTEFELNGRRYDVLSVAVKSDGIFVTCIADTEEDELLAGLEKNTDTDHGARQKARQKKYDDHYFPSLISLPGAGASVFIPVHILAAKPSPVYRQLSSPPPRQA